MQSAQTVSFEILCALSGRRKLCVELLAGINVDY
jgi:hypothetical protein